MTTQMKVGVSLPPRLQAGERVLYFKPVVWAASGKSLPSYRLSLWLPFVQEMGLYITDRRVFLPCCLFRLFRVEWSAWLTRADQNTDQDHLETAAVGRKPFGGSYLELITSNSVKHWWRAEKARVRLFMKDPETLCRLLGDRLRVVTPDGDQAARRNGSPAGAFGNSGVSGGPASVS